MYHKALLGSLSCILLTVIWPSSIQGMALIVFVFAIKEGFIFKTFKGCRKLVRSAAIALSYSLYWHYHAIRFVSAVCVLKVLWPSCLIL